MNKHHEIASADFSKKTLKALSKQNIFINGIQMAMGSNGWANPTKGYTLNNNGTGMVRSFYQVLAMAGEKVPAWAANL